MPEATVKQREKRHKHHEDRQRHNQSLRTYSFFATLLIIAVVIGATYVSSLPHIEQIPETFEFKSQPWMRYVPNPVEYALYVNFDNAYALAGSPEVFGSEPLVQLYQLNFSVYPREVFYVVDMQLPSPLYGGTVSVLKLHSETLARLQTQLEKAGKTSLFSYQGYTIHVLLMKKAGDQKLGQGFLSIADGYAVLSNDQTKGREEVQRVLDQFAFGAPNLFDDVTVRRGVYSSGVADQDYVGLYVGMFQTQLNYSRMIVKSVVQDGRGILVTRSILFPSNDIALNQFGEAHRIYRDASSYRILDSWLVVAYNYSIDRLRTELTGI